MGAKVDSEHIDASEIPELPIVDPSQIDLDIDDPAGQVRVVMTKDAQDVAVRLETPQQVLNEYQQMESEMERALAMKSLNLSDFNASQHGADDQGRESGRGEAEPGQKNSSKGEHPRVREGLEQSGTTARLVNRIV